MYTRLVGDIHGNTKHYRQLLEGAEASVQVGDYGVGFQEGHDKAEELWQTNNPQHRFIRGNHDSPERVKTMPGYIGDYKLEGTTLYIGGAWSIDYYHRKTNKNWWSDEELTQEQFDELEDLYVTHRPRVVVSHDAPRGMPREMKLLDPAFGGETITRTAYRLGMMFLQHQPEYWFFGHWHKSATQLIQGTHFRCLAAHEVTDFDLGNVTY